MSILEIPSKKKSIIACGIMTGTSVDGIDIALVRFTESDNNHEFEMISFDCFELSPEAKESIEKAIRKDCSTSYISKLNFLLSKEYALAIEKLCKNSSFDQKNIDVIGVHGQTVWHEPESGHSLQLCNLSALAKATGCVVIGDFRSGDIALGGQGAPLVPIFDHAFLRNESEDVIALNIGGIANITYLPSESKDLQAFDTGPGNTWIDLAMREFFDKKYDENGETAKEGKIVDTLFENLKSIEFIKRGPPKSTGRELFSKENFENIIDISWKKIDIVRTLTEFTAFSIAENIKMIGAEQSKVYVSGGGVKNGFLMKRLSEYLLRSEIKSIAEIGIIPDAKEAICFAYLAFRTMKGLESNIPSISGAEKNTILGQIAIP
jgi:anhydro-N-acetylmuramic acid kinase